MKYFVETWSYWMIVSAKSKAKAKSEGIKEWGRGMVKSVRRATQNEIESYEAQKGNNYNQ